MRHGAYLFGWRFYQHFITFCYICLQFFIAPVHLQAACSINLSLQAAMSKQQEPLHI